MRINIHWGEFGGPIKRAEIKFSIYGNERKDEYGAYKNDTELQGYLPFALFKNNQTKQWVLDQPVDPCISDQENFYTKKMTEDVEQAYEL